MYLGTTEDREVSVIEMSERLIVPRDHLLEGLRALKELELVRRAPGRTGGFRLGPACSRVRLGRVVRALEPSRELRECTLPVPTCPMAGACGLSRVLDQARDAYTAELDQYTVWDLVTETRTGLVQLTAGG
jgi:Rrf2 family nitric oxide-sensitive transcriptional repressor